MLRGLDGLKRKAIWRLPFICMLLFEDMLRLHSQCRFGSGVLFFSQQFFNAGNSY